MAKSSAKDSENKPAANRPETAGPMAAATRSDPPPAPPANTETPPAPRQRKRSGGHPYERCTNRIGVKGVGRGLRPCGSWNTEVRSTQKETRGDGALVVTRYCWCRDCDAEYKDVTVIPPAVPHYIPRRNRPRKPSAD